MLTLYTLAQAWISGDTVSVALESDEVSSWWNNCGIEEYNDDDDDDGDRDDDDDDDDDGDDDDRDDDDRAKPLHYSSHCTYSHE